eukprot:scaffold102634_cov57-Phaeocystis_antarctica.AAC.1
MYAGSDQHVSARRGAGTGERHTRQTSTKCCTERSGECWPRLVLSGLGWGCVLPIRASAACLQGGVPL